MIKKHIPEPEGFFRLRRKVFKEKLNWYVSVIGEFESDQFDLSDVLYLLYIDEPTYGK